jgi:hypothetical protein
MIIDILRIGLIFLGIFILGYTTLNDTGFTLIWGIISGIGCFYIAYGIKEIIEDN